MVRIEVITPLKELTTVSNSLSNKTWKQVKSTRGLVPPQALQAQYRKVVGQISLLGHQEIKLLYRIMKMEKINDLPDRGEGEDIDKNGTEEYQKVKRHKILRSNDVETNPGPENIIASYNIRGMKDYNKTKRVLNYFNRFLKADTGIILLHETHINCDEARKLDFMWRGKYVVAPGSNSARGTIMLYAPNQFDNVIHQEADPEGRCTWMIATRKDSILLYSGIYGPNKNNHTFYTQYCRKTNELIEKYNVTECTIGGDLNIELKATAGRFITANETKAVKILQSFMSANNMTIVSNTKTHTWHNKKRQSTIDYIISNSPVQWDNSTKWGIDKSDHALITATYVTRCDIGPGIPRISPDFLNNQKLSTTFKENIYILMSQASTNWNPHERLEYMKMCIRSEAFECQGRLKKQENVTLTQLQEDLIKANNEFNKAKETAKPKISEKIDLIQEKVDEILDNQSKQLAQRARVQWIEKGERNNKYFLNLIKNNRKRNAITTVIKGEEEIRDPERIKQHIKEFYQELYNKNPAEDTNINAPPELVNEEENEELTKPITIEELHNTLKKAKGTTPGPDGIPSCIYKTLWPLAGKIILEAWEYSISKGTLPASQKESVICLLEKKGKDKRIINNLRPITLSNCDLKLITKTYTTRINKILNRILLPNQTAYLTGRQVHDGLRAIDLIKENHKGKREGYLISLDAKKAYDSVSHEYIKAALGKYGFDQKFLNIFEILYWQITTKVIVNGYMTESINIGRGVKQGDALSCSLFILVMDTVIRRIENNPNISKVKIGTDTDVCTNTFAYADDLAVIVESKNQIQTVLELYESFSTQSGLYLNADKTEILNIKEHIQNEEVEIRIYQENIKIKMVKQIKICGKSFSLDPATEHKENIETPINKIAAQINQWKKRKLTTEGRILVVKTFGLSQVIYNLQNTAYDQKDLEKIDSMVYKFIWNGPDKIKRETIRKNFCEGGLKGPDIAALDKTLKLKQTLRACTSNHDIQRIQNVVFAPDQPELKTNAKCPFINKAANTYKEIYKQTTKAITNDPETNLHRTHIIRLRNLKIKNIEIITGSLNPITKCYLEAFARSRNIQNLIELIKYLQNNPEHQLISRILTKIPETLKERMTHTSYDNEKQDESISRMIAIRPNIFRHIKQLKHREIYHATTAETIEGMNNPYLMARKIRHPRERMCQYMDLQKKTYTNERLFRFKMKESPACNTCPDKIEDANHLYHECTRAVKAWKIYQEVTKNEINTKLINEGAEQTGEINIISMVKLHLYLNREHPICPEVLTTKILNRISDQEKMKANTAYQKQKTRIQT